MAETYEYFKRTAPLRTALIISDSNASPYTVALPNVVGISVVNLSSANAVTFTVTLDDGTAHVIPVPADGIYHGEFEDEIATIAYAGTSPDFSLELMRRIL